MFNFVGYFDNKVDENFNTLCEFLAKYKLEVCLERLPAEAAIKNLWVFIEDALPQAIKTKEELLAEYKKECEKLGFEPGYNRHLKECIDEILSMKDELVSLASMIGRYKYAYEVEDNMGFLFTNSCLSWYKRNRNGKRI